MLMTSKEMDSLLITVKYVILVASFIKAIKLAAKLEPVQEPALEVTQEQVQMGLKLIEVIMQPRELKITRAELKMYSLIKEW